MLTTPRSPSSLLVVFSPMKFEDIQLATNPPNSSPSADVYIKYIPKLQNPALKIIFLPGKIIFLHFIVLIIFTACPTDARSCCLEKIVFCSFSLGRLDSFPFDKLKYYSARQYPDFPLHRGGIFLLLPCVSGQNIAYLVFIVLGKKLLLQLFASSFPECMK